MSRQPIFICYRRTDSGWAGRLEDELVERFGNTAVFRDRTIPAGVPWREHIESVLDGCEVMLVMIGPSWSQLSLRDGVARIWEVDDVVRQEIERGLARADVQVIPVLFGGAEMPTREQLPAGLHRLCDLQAVELDDTRWEFDTGELGNQLATVVPELQADDAHAAMTGRAVLAMMAAAAVAALLAAPLAGERTWHAASHAGRWSGAWLATELPRLGGIAVHMALLWGIVGALTLGALYMTLRHTRAGTPVGVAIGLGCGAIAGAAGAFVYVVLKDVASVHLSEALLNAAAVGGAGLVFADRIGELAGGVDRTISLTVGVVGGLLAGVLGSLVDQQGMHAVAWAVQAIVLSGALASLLAAPSLALTRSPQAAIFGA